MIRDHQVRRRGDEIILGLAVQDAVLDILTNPCLLQKCLNILTEPQQGLVDTTMGKFGEFQVTLNRHADDTVSIFVDGPRFDGSRVQSSAIWPDKKSLVEIIEAVLKDGQQ